jgi:hypothetical protein
MDNQFRTWLEMGQDLSTLNQKSMASLTSFPSWMELFPGKGPEKEADEGEGGL